MSSPVEMTPSNVHTGVRFWWDVTLRILVECCKHMWPTFRFRLIFILKKTANSSDASVRTECTTRRQLQKTILIKIALATSNHSFTCI